MNSSQIEVYELLHGMCSSPPWALAGLHLNQDALDNYITQSTHGCCLLFSKINNMRIGKRKCTFASPTIQKLLQLLKEEKV
ncbi:hypothetical protein AMTRI_Chr03g144530 [Amborella trichopoda]